ncbi:metallopeptidase TldD-related protein [Bacillus clarus]|uniref:Modulator of DNA gyrase family protein n=2 Tax=Bacillus clarus TaxID=2338372 RepID=A0A090YSE7_9BACI|nr:metallopeptidase TldD-related protein [Bacillus clarus]KFN01152.1 modulator of DNA gyrase family protein [Bacillus clarus]
MKDQLRDCINLLELNVLKFSEKIISYKIDLNLNNERIPLFEEPVNRYNLLILIHVEGKESIIPILWQVSTEYPPVCMFSDQIDELRVEIEQTVHGKSLKDKLKLPVILDQWPASHFVHECFGHTSEADNYMEYACENDYRLGYRWSDYKFNVYDDPTLIGNKAHYGRDDEGEKSFCTQIIKDGIWCNLLHSSETKKKLQAKGSCNGRKVSYDDSILPRMSITYMDKGNENVDDLISQIEYGLLCKGSWGGGSIGTKFIIRPSYGIIIKNGSLSDSIIRRFDIKGCKFKAARNIVGSSNELRMFNPVFGCDKNNQNNLSVTQGAPHIYFKELDIYPI